MKKRNSQKKSAFSLILFLLSIIIVPFILGIETFKVLILCMGVVMFEMAAIGVVILIIYTIVEEIKHRRKKEEES